MKRRDFLASSLAGGAMLSMPFFLHAANAAGALAEVPHNPFMTWFGVDEAVMRRVLKELVANGADDAELYFEHSRSNSIQMEDRIISSAVSSIAQGVGLRVVVGDQTGFAFTEDLSLDAMLKAARTAAAIARGGGASVPQHFNPQKQGDLYRISVPWADVGIDRKLPLITKVEAMAQQRDPAIQKVRVKWSDNEQKVMIATLDGRIVTDYRPMTRLWCSITAKKNGEVQSNASNLAARQGLDFYTDERLKILVDQAVDRTMVLFDARRPPAGEMPVVLAAGASGILLHEAIGHGMEADFNRKGTSIYSDMLNKKVAEPFVTVVDQGTLPHERGAINYDDEGNPSQRNVLVENGVLKSYLQDNISARHYKLKPTGSGRRESYKHNPMPRMTCTFMEDGPHSKDEMVASMKKGIIAETYTNGQVQIGAGDFTFYIKNGWLVENGKITAPIKDCNIIGNGPEVLKRITMVAGDGKLDTGGWTCGKNGQSVPVSQGMPSVLVSRMTVGGEHVS
jgi:TldD protein